MNLYSYWQFIHIFSYHKVDADLLKNVVNYLPCDECKQEWIQPPENTDELFQWSIDLHNVVNQKLGKPIFNSNNIYTPDLTGCFYCKYPQSNSYPWGFIHNVAKFEGSLEYLKEFNNNFPCDKCRNTFFTDEPASDETTFQWTLRHHNRINHLKGLNEITEEMFDWQNCSAC